MIPLRRTFFALAATLLACTTAQADQKPIWGLQAYGDVCRVKFGQKEIKPGVWRLIKVDKGCDIANFKGYAMHGDSHIRFYGKQNSLIASADKGSDGQWRGVIHDGDPFQMVYFGQAKGNKPAKTTNNTQTSAAVGQCVTYVNAKNRCASPEDTTYKAFETFALQPLAPLNLYFMPDTASRVQSVTPRNICFQEVRTCTERFFDKEIWCQVSVGDQSGWILRKDANHVYASKGCG